MTLSGYLGRQGERQEVLEKHFSDPDTGLELRDEVKAQLLASEDEVSIPIEDVAKALGLTW